MSNMKHTPSKDADLALAGIVGQVQYDWIVGMRDALERIASGDEHPKHANYMSRRGMAEAARAALRETGADA